MYSPLIYRTFKMASAIAYCPQTLEYEHDSQHKLLRHMRRIRLSGIPPMPASAPVDSGSSFEESTAGTDASFYRDEQTGQSRRSPVHDHISDHIDNLWKEIRQAKERKLAFSEPKIESLVRVTSAAPSSEERQLSNKTEPSSMRTASNSHAGRIWYS